MRGAARIQNVYCTFFLISWFMFWYFFSQKQWTALCSLTVGLSLAVLPVCGLGPVAHSRILIEPESGRAGVLLGQAVHARVEDVADGGVGVGVEPVEPGAGITRALRALCTSVSIRINHIQSMQYRYTSSTMINVTSFVYSKLDMNATSE
jgi:hypothetical protein